MKSFLKLETTRKYGTGEITISLQMDTPTDVDKGLIELDLLLDQSNRMFEHFIEHHLPKWNKPIPNENVTTKLIPATEIRVTMDKGKKYYKVAGGEYTEHGINFWPEHMKQCGVNPKLIPDEGYKLKEGTQALIEMVDGKPKRVLKLTRE